VVLSLGAPVSHNGCQWHVGSWALASQINDREIYVRQPAYELKLRNTTPPTAALQAAVLRFGLSKEA
jgi:hypothetical protein